VVNARRVLPQRRTMSASYERAYQTTHGAQQEDGAPAQTTPPPDEAPRADEPPAASGAVLGLPAPRPAAPGEPPRRTIDLSSGEAVSLDHLGPVVVGTDGTLARIANWAQMTPPEQAVTQRRIAERNNARLATLRAQSAVGAPLD
jgi:hypothetical protein